MVGLFGNLGDSNRISRTQHRRVPLSRFFQEGQGHSLRQTGLNAIFPGGIHLGTWHGDCCPWKIDGLRGFLTGERNQLIGERPIIRGAITHPPTPSNSRSNFSKRAVPEPYRVYCSFGPFTKLEPKRSIQWCGVKAQIFFKLLVAWLLDNQPFQPQ